VYLKGLTKLSYLVLSDTKVTSLSTLRVGATQISDAGLAHLSGLSNLADLEIAKTQVSDAGLKRLKQALPSLTIVR
jgi:hypothetical protein